MNRILTSLILCCASFFLALRSASAITIDTVPVRNGENAPDQDFGNGGQFGSVGDSYRIGKYEVTIGQYTAFLNAVAATDTYLLYNVEMATDLNIAGIAQEGSPGNYTYSVIGSPNHPVTYVNWGDAARFANWLHNGQPGLGGPTVPQNAASTEDGAYPLNGAKSDDALNSVSRNAAARWFIPTENEWYKAAYHQPAGLGGDGDNYWFYPTRTNSEPNSDQPPGDPSVKTNVANFYRDDSLANGFNDGMAVTGTTTSNSIENYLTDVGAFSSAQGPYGTFDQGGNVREWNEAVIGDFRGLRGGSWNSASSGLRSSLRGSTNPSGGFSSVGFRVATVPEPCTAALAVVACLTMYRLRKRFM